MRKLMIRFGVAVVVAGALAVTATPASAVVTKKCWSHQDTDQFLADGITPNPNYLQYVRVWASGGGHDKHQLAGTDTFLGDAESYAACVAIIATN